MNTMIPFPLKPGLALILLAGVLTVPGHAAGFLNGGFESGLANWTTVDQVGSEGTFLPQSGTISPVSGLLVPSPPQGSAAVMTHALGPGSHVLYQDFVVPGVVSAAFLDFSVYVNNLAQEFFPQAHLDFATLDLNQQARVDLMLGTADPFSTTPGDILQNLYRTQVGDPSVSGYNTYAVDVTSVLQPRPGQTLRLRFAEVDNVNIFNFGVDNVGLRLTDPAIPEPGTWIAMPAVAGLAAISFQLRRRRTA